MSSSQVFTKDETDFVMEAVKEQIEASKNILQIKTRQFEEEKKRMDTELLKLKAEIQKKETALTKMQMAVGNGNATTISERKTIADTVRDIETKRKEVAQPKQPVISNKPDLNDRTEVHYKKSNGTTKVYKIPTAIIQHIKDNYLDNKWRHQQDLIKPLSKEFPKYSDGTLSVYINRAVEYLCQHGLAEKVKDKVRLHKYNAHSNPDEIQNIINKEYEKDRYLKK